MVIIRPAIFLPTRYVVLPDIRTAQPAELMQIYARTLMRKYRCKPIGLSRAYGP